MNGNGPGQQKPITTKNTPKETSTLSTKEISTSATPKSGGFAKFKKISKRTLLALLGTGII